MYDNDWTPETATAFMHRLRDALDCTDNMEDACPGISEVVA